MNNCVDKVADYDIGGGGYILVKIAIIEKIIRATNFKHQFDLYVHKEVAKTKSYSI